MSHPLADSHVPLHINIFDQTQHALVRKHLTIDRLIADILREFAQELDLNRKYILLYDGRQLDPELIISDVNFEADKELVFAYYEPVRSGSASPLSTSEVTASKLPTIAPNLALIAVLREMETGQEFPLVKTPSVIGRSSTASATNEGIDIDVKSFREARTVSRPHAQISHKDGRYYFEGLKEQRPVFINDIPLPFGKKHTLRTGDIVGVGNVRFMFELT
jgi:hypothetical protein